MLSEREVLSTINMLRSEHLDVRTVTLGIAQNGMLTISTQDAYYLQNVMRAPTAKKKTKKAAEPPAAKAA